VAFFVSGFDTTFGNNAVTFNNGAVGTVTASTSNSLTVTLGTPPSTAGDLTVEVVTNGVSSGAMIKVATVVPVLTINTTDLAADETEIIISGFGFDPTPGNNLVTFNGGAVGNVTAATATSLTVCITTNGEASGAAVEVATVTPVATINTSSLAANASTVVINGFGFSATPASNTIVFNNNAVGTVTAASATSLTVTFSTKPRASGTLTAIITSNGISSASVQVAAVLPVVGANSAFRLSASATTITINGAGFDTDASKNTVVFNNGATGTVTAATASSLSVTFDDKPVAAGSLTAVVTTNDLASVAAVQVANVAPLVTSSSADLAANAATITINGFGFDSTAANNSVVFNNGAIGNVTAATATSLTVTFTTNPTSVGNLTAIVTSNTVNSGTAVQVATVKPVVTIRTDAHGVSAPTIVINGFGFDTTAGNNTVVFNNGAIGSVTAATATTLTVTFSIKPTTLGSLTAAVTTKSLSSGSATQVATVTPVVTLDAATLASDATSLVINGFGFDTTAGNNRVVFNSGAVGAVTAATTTSLTFTFSTKPKAGDLTAVVAVNGVSSGSAVKVATVSPIVTSNVTNLAASVARVVISGFGFDPIAANNTVLFSNGGVGTVSAATATSLTVTLSTAPAAGNLTAVVTTNSVSSVTLVQVATVSAVVTSSTADLNANAATVVINGFGFNPVAASNTVVFSNGAVGTVTTATATSLTVTFSTKPTTMGSLTAVVTTNSISSGSAIQVATVIPVVTLATTVLAISANTITINGFGFSNTAANNAVTFNNGAIGTVTLATATRLTVTFGTKPTVVGNLTAVVTTNSVSSGAGIQVANVRPAVTLSTASLLSNATTIIINGIGFSTTPGNNTVVFDNGADGTVTASTATELTVTAATATSLTVTFGIKPVAAGILTAVINANFVSSGVAVQVATMI